MSGVTKDKMEAIPLFKNVKELMNRHKGPGNWVTNPEYCLIVYKFPNYDREYHLLYDQARKKVHEYLSVDRAYELHFSYIDIGKSRLRVAGVSQRRYQTYPACKPSDWPVEPECAETN